MFQDSYDASEAYLLLPAIVFRLVVQMSLPNSIIQADDELDLPVLAGFEWDPEECYTRFIVHQKKEGAAPPSKKKKKNAIDE
jgi:hypothetical protein